MKPSLILAGCFALVTLLLTGVSCPPALAQVPVVAPIVVDTAVPIIVSAVKPKPSGLAKFEGFVMHANVAQITVRAKGNDLAIRTFALSDAAAAKMQQIVVKGGYQYSDNVTAHFAPASH